MDNLFEKVTDDELKKYYKQFCDWEKTGVISGEELVGKRTLKSGFPRKLE